MRAPPDENDDVHYESDADDSEEDAPVPGRGLPGGFPDRSETGSTYY